MLNYRYRIYPTKKQIKIMEQTIEECRWLYNHFLEERKKDWKEKKKSLNYHNQAVSLPKLKKERRFLKNIHSQALQNVAVRVDLTFKNFFRRVKAGKKPGYPRFKGKSWYDSFTYPQTGFKVENGKLELSKIGSIKIVLHRPFEKSKTCTIRRAKTGKWYATFTCEGKNEILKSSKKTVGIDVGIENFATFSNGKKIENPRFFKTDQKALAKAQRKLSKLKKQSPKREKIKKIVAHIYEKIFNRRNNFCHQEARKIVNRFGIICIEDLSINKMRENNFRSINRNISDVAWGQFAQYLAYKAESAGRQLIKVNPAFTSQTCSRCGYRKSQKLSDRIFQCPDCGLEISRDHNSAINILTLGTQSLERLQPSLRSPLL